MAKAAPAYSMYPDAFEQGTDAMTLTEVGAYIRLLNSQWAKGSIPGDDVKALSRILRCDPSTAKRVWTVLRDKFSRGEDGGWRNGRMERERAKQDLRRTRLAENGAKGGRPPRNQKDNQKDNQNESNRFQNAKPNRNQNESLPSPDPGSLSVPLKQSTTTSTPSGPASASAAPLVMSPARYEKLQQSHAFVGARLKVPNVLHEELRDKLGGQNANGRLLDWYSKLNAAAEENGTPIPDVFEWLRPQFVEWARRGDGDPYLRSLEQSTARHLEKLDASIKRSQRS
jgi:uncharacterized protein YdaU (DUF1376 family)